MKKKEQFVLVRCPIIASNHKVKNKQNLGGSINLKCILVAELLECSSGFFLG